MDMRTATGVIWTWELRQGSYGHENCDRGHMDMRTATGGDMDTRTATGPFVPARWTAREPELLAIFIKWLTFCSAEITNRDVRRAVTYQIIFDSLFSNGNVQ